MSPLLVAAAACALAAAEGAEPGSTPRVSLGVGAALAFPSGELMKGAELKDRVERAFPFELRAGWRVTPAIELGLSGGYAFGSVGTVRSGECAALGVACDVHLWRAAARAEHRWRSAKWILWGAALLGWEQLAERWEQDEADWERRRWNGWRAGVEAGVDGHAARALDVGVFAALGVGQHRWRSVSGETAGYAYEDSGAVADPAVHRWITLGVRGTLGL